MGVAAAAAGVVSNISRSRAAEAREFLGHAFRLFCGQETKVGKPRKGFCNLRLLVRLLNARILAGNWSPG